MNEICHCVCVCVCAIYSVANGAAGTYGYVLAASLLSLACPPTCSAVISLAYFFHSSSFGFYRAPARSQRHLDLPRLSDRCNRCKNVFISNVNK